MSKYRFKLNELAVAEWGREREHWGIVLIVKQLSISDKKFPWYEVFYFDWEESSNKHKILHIACEGINKDIAPDDINEEGGVVWLWRLGKRYYPSRIKKIHEFYNEQKIQKTLEAIKRAQSHNRYLGELSLGIAKDKLGFKNEIRRLLKLL